MQTTITTILDGLASGYSYRIAAGPAGLVQVTHVARGAASSTTTVGPLTVSFRKLDPQTLGQIGPVESLRAGEFAARVLRSW